MQCMHFVYVDTRKNVVKQTDNVNRNLYNIHMYPLVIQLYINIVIYNPTPRSFVNQKEN
jgi:hypothetical protein